MIDRAEGVRDYDAAGKLNVKWVDMTDPFAAMIWHFNGT
jgi:hypothetical protein